MNRLGSLFLLGALTLSAREAAVLAQSRIEFEVRQFGAVIRLHTRSVGQSVFPDYHLERSEDLATWETAGLVAGGIGIWPEVYEFPWNTNELRQFFRVRERFNVAGANLANVDFSGQNHSGASLPWAQLSRANLQNADFSNANLQHAMLREAKLSGISLGGANLCYADLAGAEAAAGDLAGAALLNTRLPDGSIATDDLTAAALGLDLSSELTPPVSLYLRIRQDLAAIRAEVPEAIPGQPIFEWGIPNGLHVWASAQQFAALNASELGPVEYLPNHYNPNQPSRIAFAQQFHPRALAMVLRKRFGIGQIEEYMFVGGGSARAKAEISAEEAKYTFSRGFGDCPSGCLQWHTWRFSVSPSGVVTILQAPRENPIVLIPIDKSALPRP